MCTLSNSCCIGGNQRDLAREKNMKKQAEHSKAKKADDKDGNKGMSLQDRKQRY
jgi:4F5 protein related disordered region